MKTKIIVLGIALALMPNMAQAKSNSHKWHYTMTYHRPTHVRCPYAGCRSDLQP